MNSCPGQKPTPGLPRPPKIRSRRKPRQTASGGCCSSALAEALSLRVPVIASDIPVHREVADKCAVYIGTIDGKTWLQVLKALTKPFRISSITFRWQGALTRYTGSDYLAQILTISTICQPLSTLFSLPAGYPAIIIGNFLQASDAVTLSLFQNADKFSCFEK